MSMRYDDAPSPGTSPWMKVARADAGVETDQGPALTPEQADANRNPRDNMSQEIRTQVDVADPRGHGVQINRLGE